MELLPKDVILIVDRYTYDYNYARLREQYKQYWLNPQYNDDDKIFWVDTLNHEGRFERMMDFGANRRNILMCHERDWEQVIYRFYSDKRVGKIPNNY